MVITRMSGISRIIPFLIIVCFFVLSDGIAYGGSNDVAYTSDISTYEFITEQSNVVQTGGIAGVHETYPIEGYFQLSINFNESEAAFEFVDANLLEPTGFLPTESLDELFNMTKLTGIFLDDTTIVFIGKIQDISNTDIYVVVIVTLKDDIVYIYGQTIPPACCDFFYFDMYAIAKKKYSGGTGEPNNPYKIATAEDLISLGEEPNDYDKHFILTDDIDLVGYTFDKAVIAPGSVDCRYIPCFPIGSFFTGYFDGNGHTISHMTIIGEDCLGLFGIFWSGAEVKDLGVVDVNITSFGKCAGGLLGYTGDGTVTGCYSTGTVNGNIHVGGLVGWNRFGYITESYSTGSVIGDGNIGGLVGLNYWGGSIISCYSTGEVNGENDVGGLVGYNDSSIISSFWDIETSGQNTSDGGTGLTTAEMQMKSTFTDAGWDFVGETANGPNDIWKIWDMYDYPRLACEPGPNTPLVFVDIKDPNFYGQMSKYEVTNDQYCDFLNAALASGDITINDTIVEGADGSNSGEDYVGESYYNLNGLGWTGAGATSGSAARINYNEGQFSVDDGFGNHPVTYISWYGAMAFANYYGYYLPTEEQWQAVADYDGTYIYGCGETIDPGIANYRDSQNPDGTTSVGSYGQYGYGMSDMAGNVWEWTSSGSESSRIFRGGSWSSYDSDCNVSIRADGVPYANYYDIGFRVCR